ncbi:MAG: hypothetical protein UR33_C0004G0047 [Candidatus Woesebacteria bacterium GW2011_GWA2_33_20]|nr:MAG: hypothetical protein UR33_C0004G0047 [Candidatus Woesebacteria bacterium GW2011_GWA2_33_20]
MSKTDLKAIVWQLLLEDEDVKIPNYFVPTEPEISAIYA